MQLGRLGLERRDDQRVVVIGDDHVFFGREVAEERTWRDLGRLSDLLHGGGLIALLLEQPHGVPADRGAGPGLLALAQPDRGSSLLLRRQLPPPIRPLRRPAPRWWRPCGAVTPAPAPHQPPPGRRRATAAGPSRARTRRGPSPAAGPRRAGGRPRPRRRRCRAPRRRPAGAGRRGPAGRG